MNARRGFVLGGLFLGAAVGVGLVYADCGKDHKADEMMKKADGMMGMEAKGGMSMMMMDKMCMDHCMQMKSMMDNCAAMVDKDPKSVKMQLQQASKMLDQCMLMQKKMMGMMGEMAMCPGCGMMAGKMMKCESCKMDMKMMKDMMMCPGCGMMSDKMMKCEKCSMDMMKMGDMMKK